MLDGGRRGPNEHERQRPGDAEGGRVCEFGTLEFGGAVLCS
jgi:hypothetical protein